jgi:pimeloyl-ACP methyl ester carboxylesterase
MPLLLALTALGLSVGASAVPYPDKKTIVWKPCPELNNFITESNGVRGATIDCANLAVPLDYENPDSEKIELDLFKLNATQVPVLGTVLYNPGGPGGTGAENLPNDGPLLLHNIGGQYHIVSWDPRGTGNTIPFNCSASGQQSLSRREANHLASANATDYFLNGGWETAVTLADACYETQNDTGQFLGTTSVAHDMLEIVDALGEDGLLRYYGWSYGSVLGAYFAALYPNRVERMVIDAVADPNIWQLGHRGDYLQDADAALDGFFKECLKNKDDCALVKSTNATTIDEMFITVNALLAPLAKNATSGPEALLSYSATKLYIFEMLYWPARWPVLAETIAAALAGQMLNMSSQSTGPKYNLGSNSLDGIRCSDTLYQVSSAEEYLPLVEYQSTISDSFSDVGYSGLWPCAAWRMPSKGRYEGDFRSTTKHPLLMVNGDYDVSTPIAGAYNASALFAGSVVLPHSGYGHGIIASPSKCVNYYLTAYFVNGTLPDPDTRCEPDLGPWEQAKAKAKAKDEDSSSISSPRRVRLRM